MLKALVTGAGGDVGEGSIRCLLKINTPVKIYATGINQYSPWVHHQGIISFIALYLLLRIYTISNQSYKKFSIDLLIVFDSGETFNCKINYIEKETSAIVFVDNYESVEICDDKFLTHQFLKKIISLS